MTRHHRMRVLAFGLATTLAGWVGMVQAAATPGAGRITTAEVVADPGKAWERFIADGDVDAAYDAYEALEKVNYRLAGVDRDACRDEWDTLAQAVTTMPVSIVLQRALMLCAEALDRRDEADHALEAVAALSRYASGQAVDGPGARPIPVFRPEDVYALLHVRGLEFKYEYYELLRPQRYFPLVVAAWDPEVGKERHLRFDYVDAIHRISRNDPYHPYPYHRSVFSEAYVSGYVKGNDIVGLDLQAVSEAAEADTPAERLARLRPVAAMGGVQSAITWLVLCYKQPSANCASGYVDALLPYAEKKQAAAMTLLAFAYHQGLGTKPDARMAGKLLDAANQRWIKDGATVAFAELWSVTHDGAIPADLQQRLERARKLGNTQALEFLVRRKIKQGQRLEADEVAFLSQPASNSTGAGYALLADYHEEAGRDAEQRQWREKAARAGDAAAQRWLAFEWSNGADAGPRDGETMALLREAAHGGDSSAMRYLGFRSSQQSRWAEAEGWLLEAAASGDLAAILDLLALYEAGHQGLSSGPDHAAKVYKLLAATDHGGEARRRLARMAIEGRGMAKDPDRARRWLLEDAEKGDHDSEIALGAAYLEGAFGKADEQEGLRWLERAASAEDAAAVVGVANYHYFKRNTAQSRRQAIALWERAEARGERLAANNLAWALCTSEDPAIVDGRKGLDVAKRMGDDAGLEARELDTVAACWAAVGDFERAVELQKRGQARLLEAEESRATVEGFQRRLKLYETRQRYVEDVSKR